MAAHFKNANVRQKLQMKNDLISSILATITSSEQMPPACLPLKKIFIKGNPFG